MDYLLATLTGLSVSLLVIPIMVRLAPVLGMLDQPGVRKVHLRPIPRVGGWGIVCGAAAALLYWQAPAALSLSFLAGALILLLGGALDDSRELKARTKLALQLSAVVPIVLYTGLSVDVLPLPFAEGLPLPPFLAATLACLGLAVCINATNTSDGLDGLAGGETLLSLLGILYLGYLSGDNEILIIAAATAGGLFGFLRFNTHPAVIFMGDAGSQFLGFAVAFLGLALMRAEPGELSLWTVALLAGLPPIDLLVVAVRRMIRRGNCFHADRTHFHHQLLELGFRHRDCVIIIYSVQALFVFFAITARHQSHTFLALSYLLLAMVPYAILGIARRRAGGRRSAAQHGKNSRILAIKAARLLVLAPRLALEAVAAAVLVICASFSSAVPADFGFLAGILIIPLIVTGFLKFNIAPFIARLPSFVMTAALLYLYTNYRPFPREHVLILELLVLSIMAFSIILAMKYSPNRRREEFHATATDYLLALVVSSFLLVPSKTLAGIDISFFLYLPVLLYACEFTLTERRERRDWSFIGLVTATGIVVFRTIA